MRRFKFKVNVKGQETCSGIFCNRTTQQNKLYEIFSVGYLTTLSISSLYIVDDEMISYCDENWQGKQ
jgi:hypothetical protein